MKLFRYLQVAIESILTYKLRAILTLLGFIIGVAAVVSMVGLGQGMSDDIMTEVSNSGSLDLLELQADTPFTNAEVAALADPVLTRPWLLWSQFPSATPMLW
ncbi:MAG: ABC transporter permease [Anaerolineales bacterium]|nr:ABC transporter permease [Anaerolineales bacterium]